MKILFITSAHNSLSQRLLIELTKRGHVVPVCVATSDNAMRKAVAEHAPELIVAPMLKIAVPRDIWSKHTCLIVHPGIRGDRGPSSLDWAIATGEPYWGVTVLEAAEEMDAGPIWASHTFPMPKGGVAKSTLYRNEVTEAAVRGVLEAVAKFASKDFVPEPLNYSHPDVRGRLRPMMRQTDRMIDWCCDSTETVMRKIRAADSAPGVLDTLFDANYFLYGAHEEERLSGAPGEILAQRHGAICRGTYDGAVWITHLKAKAHGPYAGLKLPAAKVLGDHVKNVPESTVSIVPPAEQATFREIYYSEQNQVGYLYFDFYNGAMDTDQCYRLRDAYLFARSRPTQIIVLMGGRDFWSNGIHLNVIEAADDPAAESWRNINAIDDVIYEILNTLSHVVIASLSGNAGAGGAMLALAADYVWAREGVVLNPHYKGMGGLYGSEYWTYSLPKRVGWYRAIELTEACLPMGTKTAKEMGFIDAVTDGNVEEFERAVRNRAGAIAGKQWDFLRGKHRQRLADERRKPLAVYRAEELTKMRVNFYGDDPAYHQARRRFVYKGAMPPKAVIKPVTLSFPDYRMSASG